MLNREEQVQAGKTLTPKCPHCKAAMPDVKWNVVAPVAGSPEGPAMAFITFFCPQCEAVLNCQLFPITDILPADNVARIRRTYYPTREEIMRNNPAA